MADDLRTVYLGQFEDDHAELIVAEFERRDIAWTFKRFGRLSRILFGEWGTRLWVDGTRLAEARTLVEELQRREWRAEE